MEEKQVVDQSDLSFINRALAAGCDVRIQKVKGGFRIVSERTKVLKRKPDPEKQKEEQTI